MRQISLTARLAHEEGASAEAEVALFQIEHPSLSAPIRLSSDPTELISEEPRIYGTRSTWLGADPETEPFLFVVAAAEAPDDQEDAPATASIVLMNVDVAIAETLRSFTSRPTIHMAVVLASSPDVVEMESRGLKIISAEGDVGEVSIAISRSPIEEESAPTDRFTRDKFPGAHR